MTITNMQKLKNAIASAARLKMIEPEFNTEFMSGRHYRPQTEEDLAKELRHQKDQLTALMRERGKRKR